ncbi:beta strand repeat-containing protein [Leptospira kirschneri]|uniref:beta strand repeat-containing protein n=1 Tax=Leptospira kirschneri TaxID=29507 RepID=UPI0002BE53A0|nr:Ig-like domain-containing protein [Leptospira kirschneri]EMK18216.1 bacterial Ig-like domain, group 2 [Leptospira kirschneri serovar Bim str. PUO 1247]
MPKHINKLRDKKTWPFLQFIFILFLTFSLFFLESCAAWPIFSGTPGLLAGKKSGANNSLWMLFLGIDNPLESEPSEAELDRIEISVPNSNLARGTTLHLNATAIYKDNTHRDISSEGSWSSTDSSILKLLTQSQFKGMNLGSGNVNVSFQGKNATTTLTVTSAVLSDLTVTCVNQGSPLPVGIDRQCKLEGIFSDGSTQVLTSDPSASWNVTQSSIAGVNTTGLVSGLSPGNTFITTSYGSKTSSLNVTVSAATLSSISVTPANSSYPLGKVQQYTAIGTYSNQSTQDLTNQVSWASLNTSVATIDNSTSAKGMLTTQSTGSANITATLGGITGQTLVNVTSAVLTSITITPANPSVANGRTLYLTATGVFSDGTVSDITNQVTWSSSLTSVATADNSGGLSGRISGVGVGSTNITAAIGGVDITVSLNVTNATLESIQVVSDSHSIARGTSTFVQAIGVYSDGSSQNISDQVAWNSSNSSILQISNLNAVPKREIQSPSSGGLGTARITATLEAISSYTDISVNAATLVSIEVSPTNPSVSSGLTVPFTATGVYTDGSNQNLTSQVTWNSSNTNRATISNANGTQGIALGSSVGTTNISATLGAVTSSATTLTVTNAVLNSITITPSLPSVAVGRSLNLTATGTYSDGSNQDLTTSVAWTSTDSSIVSVDNASGRQGQTTGVAQGNTQISATLGGTSSAINFTVSAAVLDSIQVTLEDSPIAKGTSTRAIATGVFSDGSNLNISDQVIWDSSQTNVIQLGVLETGPKKKLMNSPANGNSTTGTSRITATLGGVSGYADLTVIAPSLTSIQIDPTHPSVANGLTQNFTATGVYSDGSNQNLTDSVTWASSNPAVATISNASGTNGKATTLQTGSTNISASLGATTSDPSVLTVTNATLTSITIAPTSSFNIAKGLNQDFVATGYYTDGSSRDLTTQVTWNSSNTSTATISNANGTQGRMAAVDTGSTNISASLGGTYSQTTNVTVTSAVLNSIQVSPADISVAKGNTKAYTAIGVYSDFSTLDVTSQVTWTSSSVSIATISNASGHEGLATAVGTGTSTITATLGGISNSTSLTVTAAVLVSLSVGPTNSFVYMTQTKNFMATGTYSDGTMQDLTTQVTWTSSDTTLGTISNAFGIEGRATGIAAGAITITATLGSISGNTSLTIIFLDTIAPTITNVVALTPTTLRITYSENVNETQAKTAANYKLALTSSVTGSCSDNSNFTSTSSVITVSSVSGSGSVFVLTLGSSQTSNAPYTILVNKSGIQDLSTTPNNLGCANYGDFLGQEQIKIVSASCANSNSVILNFSKAPKSGNNVAGSAECTGSAECSNRYKISGASDLGTINSVKVLDGIICNGATADSAKVCVIHNLVQTGAQYTIITADSVDGDGFDNSSWGSIRNSLDTENLQSSPRDRASFLGCGTSPVNFADGPISIDPNSSTFGYLIDFNSKIYSGPNNSGNGALRFAYDGSVPESVQFSFEKDTTAQDGDATNVSSNSASSRENSISVPPYVTLGHSGCTTNNGTLSLGCGPDNENGRGVFATGILSSVSYLFVAGAKTVADGLGQYLFDYLYYSADTSTNTSFKYIDLGSITGTLTAGTSSLTVLNNRVFAGFAKSSNDGIGLFGGLNAPDFGFVTFNSADSGTGFCTPGSNCDAFDGTKGKRIRIDFLPYFGGPSTGLLGINNNAHPNWAYYIGVDSMFVFKNRIYAANGGLHAVGHNGSIIRSTTADPTAACTGPDSCSNWVEIGPRTNTKWHNSPTNNWFSLELNQFYNLIPGDKAFAQFAEFNNNLYVTRTICIQSSQATGIRTNPGTVTGCTDGTTTNRRAQLWKCDPTISGNTSECDAADWSVVGDDGTGITNMGDSTNRTITMVMKNGSYLYIGYDNPNGIRIYRTNVANPGSSSASWSQIAGNGLTDATNVQQIYSAVSVPSGSINYIYVSAGKSNVSVRTYRQQN